MAYLLQTPALCPVRADVFDAYVATTGTVKLIDFSPVGGTTHPLLFEWDELGYSRVDGEGSQAQQQPSEAGPQAQAGTRPAIKVRVVPAGASLQHGHRTACAMPFDMLSLSDQNTVEGMVRMMQHDRE